MQRSTDRILTTHAGSLARPADLLAMVRAKEAGQPYDHKAFAVRVRAAVAEVVGKQIDAGVDVVSDGEQGKPGFANYVKDRLTGLVAREGVPPRISSDQADCPDVSTARRGQPEHPPDGVHRTARVEGQDRGAEHYAPVLGLRAATDAHPRGVCGVHAGLTTMDARLISRPLAASDRQTTTAVAQSL